MTGLLFPRPDKQPQVACFCNADGHCLAAYSMNLENVRLPRLSLELLFKGYKWLGS
ncbi:hypothetical protein LINGRAHAP2_LOCUS17663 [Linum grandiflorum]